MPDWFRNLRNCKHFGKQTNFIWMGKLLAACKVLTQYINKDFPLEQLVDAIIAMKNKRNLIAGLVTMKPGMHYCISNHAN